MGYFLFILFVMSSFKIQTSLQLKDFGLRDSVDFLASLGTGDPYEKQFGKESSNVVAAFYTPILRYQLHDIDPDEYSKKMV